MREVPLEGPQWDTRVVWCTCGVVVVVVRLLLLLPPSPLPACRWYLVLAAPHPPIPTCGLSTPTPCSPHTPTFGCRPRTGDSGFDRNQAELLRAMLESSIQVIDRFMPPAGPPPGTELVLLPWSCC